jgi:tripartite-type tricarboxylate transporter receptor subunit TctC
MVGRQIIARGLVCAAAGFGGGVSGAQADPVRDFYAGKTMNVIVSTGAGSIFDNTARAISRHMQRHLPGAPAFVVRNMPGAGHMRATQFMYAQVPKDGTHIAVVNNGIPLEQLVAGPSARFDVRQFNWIGSAGLSNLLTFSWHTTNVKSVEDVMSRELIMGATGVSSNGFLYPNVLNILIGTKFKIVSGYGTSTEADLGMERGEVSGRAGFSLSAVLSEHPDWIEQKKINILFQTGLAREQSLPDTPLMQELAKTNEQREVLMLLSQSVGLGRPFFTTPDVPGDRVAALRKAFDATMNDAAFRKEADTQKLDIRPMDGETLARLVRQIVDAPHDIAEKVRGAYGREDGKP